MLGRVPVGGGLPLALADVGAEPLGLQPHQVLRRRAPRHRPRVGRPLVSEQHLHAAASARGAVAVRRVVARRREREQCAARQRRARRDGGELRRREGEGGRAERSQHADLVLQLSEVADSGSRRRRFHRVGDRERSRRPRLARRWPRRPTTPRRAPTPPASSPGRPRAENQRRDARLRGHCRRRPAGDAAVDVQPAAAAPPRARRVAGLARHARARIGLRRRPPRGRALAARRARDCDRGRRALRHARRQPVRDALRVDAPPAGGAPAERAGRHARAARARVGRRRRRRRRRRPPIGGRRADVRGGVRHLGARRAARDAPPRADVAVAGVLLDVRRPRRSRSAS